MFDITYNDCKRFYIAAYNIFTELRKGHIFECIIVFSAAKYYRKPEDGYS